MLDILQRKIGKVISAKCLFNVFIFCINSLRCVHTKNHILLYFYGESSPYQKCNHSRWWLVFCFITPGCIQTCYISKAHLTYWGSLSAGMAIGYTGPLFAWMQLSGQKAKINLGHTCLSEWNKTWSNCVTVIKRPRLCLAASWVESWAQVGRVWPAWNKHLC